LTYEIIEPIKNLWKQSSVPSIKETFKWNIKTR
jgi:hypothetical protein